MNIYLIAGAVLLSTTAVLIFNYCASPRRDKELAWDAE